MTTYEPTARPNRAARRAAAKRRPARRASAALSGLALAGGVVSLVPGASPAGAATFTVTNTDDAGPGSLRAAIAAANADQQPDVITFDPSVTGTITLTQQLRINSPIEVDGPGAAALAIDGNDVDRVFYLYSAGGVAVTLSGLTITGGDPGIAADGGGIWSVAVDLRLERSIITGNNAAADGGGIYLYGGSLTIADSTVTANTSGGEGGGVFLHSGELTVSSSTISENGAGGWGGGIALYQAAVSIDDTTIAGNYAYSGGGGLGLWEGSDSVLDGVTVSNNETAGGAGGISVGYGSVGLEISDSAITGNIAADNGGGLYFYYHTGPATIVDSVITGNQADRGGGIAFEYLNGAARVERSTIADNTASDVGGGVFLGNPYPYGSLTIDRSTLSGNQAGTEGGGLNMFGLSEPLLIESSTISGNEAGTEGGGIYLYGDAAMVTVRHSTVAENAAPSGGGIHNADADENVTLDHTVLSSNSGGDASGRFAARFSLVTDPGAAAIADAGGNLPAGTDPGLGDLADNGGPTLTHLPSRTSALIDRGDPAFTGPPSTDQRGRDRVALDAIDIGAVEACHELTGVGPFRILDTRNGTGTGVGPLGPQSAIILDVTGVGDVPATGVSAVVMNLTSTGATAPSFVTAWPTGLARPNVSNVNTEPGQDVPNLAIVPVGADGTISLYNNAGQGHLVGDVVGWFAAGCDGFSPVAPTRISDSRQTTPFGAGETRSVDVTGPAGVPANDVSAVVVNITSTGATAPSFVTAWPSGEPRPNASNVNTEPGQDVPNLAIVAVGADGTISLYNNAGAGHLVVDIYGYFTTDSAFVSTNPERKFDTRSGVPVGPLGRIEPALGLAEGALAFMNVTSTESTAPSFVTTWTTGEPRPNASSLNTEPGVDVPNLALVQVGPGGRVSLFNNAGQVHLLGDLVGFYPPG